ncbi:MAG TPA: ester cyclase, partial [Longimicrobiales bacterium]|nr:ester cyclase [Longimicrobiales bacterium]
MDEIEEATRAVATRWFHEVWTEHRSETIRELWKPGAICTLEGAPPVTMADYLAYHEQMLRAFSDFRVDVLDIVTDDNRAAVEWRITGTHDGPLMGVPPSGHHIEEYGVTIMIVEGGQLAGGRDSWNFGALLAQLARPP